MSDNYVFKTNRDKQWKKLEELYIDHGNTRKELKMLKRYFYQGCEKDSTFDFTSRMAFFHDRSIEGLQTFFDEDITTPLTDRDFTSLQYYFCGQLYEYFFDVEDQSYYFKQAFGERYDPERKFSIRINRELEFRTITLTPNQIFSHLMTYFSFYLQGRKIDCSGLVRFNLNYLDSLLPLVDTSFYSADEYNHRPETEDGVRLAALKSSVKKILKWSYAKPSKKIDQERIDAAIAVKDVFLKHADNLGEFNALHDQIRQELKIKD